MARGGKRPGAGRKPGGKNARHSRNIVLEAQERGETPLQYMLAIMKDQTVPIERRDEMAKAAAPYCHPRLQAAALALSGTDELASLLQEINGTSRGLPRLEADDETKH
jgi:hypothetical protein